MFGALVRLICAATAVAGAVSLLPASVHIVKWSPSGYGSRCSRRPTRPRSPRDGCAGDADRSILVAPAGGRQLHLTLHVGPNAGRIQLAVDGRDHSVELSADETRELDVPIEGQSLVAISVRASASFIPADINPDSTDTRWLGCQVRVEVR